MTIYCQSCGQPLGPEPAYDRPMGWLRMLCQDCLLDMDRLTTQDAGDHFEFDEEQDDDE